MKGESATDKLLDVIQTWIETESGPTQATFSIPELQVKISIRGHKKITLERTFGGTKWKNEAKS